MSRRLVAVGLFRKTAVNRVGLHHHGIDQDSEFTIRDHDAFIGQLCDRQGSGQRVNEAGQQHGAANNVPQPWHFCFSVNVDFFFESHIDKLQVLIPDP